MSTTVKYNLQKKELNTPVEAHAIVFPQGDIYAKDSDYYFTLRD